MSFFNEYPYRNLTDLNLDFLLNTIKNVEKEIHEFVTFNALKYADPIQWDITSQYEKNTIVIDPVTGTAYISVQAIPYGVALTNTDYWCVVFDLERFVNKANNNFTLRVEERTTTTATFNTPLNHWLIWGGVLYRANTNIIAGDRYVVGSNITRITITDTIGIIQDLNTDDKSNIVASINEVLTKLADETTAREDADTALQAAIDNEATARQDADTALQDNIDAEAQARQDADTVEEAARQDADTTLQDHIDDEATARQDADTTLQDHIDDEAQARQDADTDLLNRINSISTGAFGEFKRQFANKKILIIGDSLSVDNTTWVKPFTDMAVSFGCTVTNISTAGDTTANALTKVNNLTDSYDVALMWIGVNDANLEVPVGFVTDTNSYSGRIKAIIDKLHSLNGNMTIFAYAITFAAPLSYDHSKSTFFYNAALLEMCKLTGVAFKNIANIANSSLYYRESMKTDGVHFTETFSKTVLFSTILNKMLTACSDTYSELVVLTSAYLTAGSGVSFSTALCNGYYEIGRRVKMNIVFTVSADIAGQGTIFTVPNSYASRFLTSFKIFNINTGAMQLGSMSAQGTEFKTNLTLAAGTYLVEMDYVVYDNSIVTFTT